MRALAAVLLTYAAVAAAYAAGSRRDQPMPRRARVLWAAAAIAFLIAAGALWPRSDGAILAGVCVVLALSAMASLFALIAPVWPRIAWVAAAVAPVAAAVLAALR